MNQSQHIQLVLFEAGDRVAVQIVRETEKALLVRDGQGREGWIQRRWISDDGTVSVKTFDKAVKWGADRQAVRDADRAWNDAYYPVVVEHETEKAVLVRVTGTIGMASSSLQTGVSLQAWIPKSVMRDGAVPGWLLRKKAAAAFEDRYGDGQNIGGYEIESIGGVSLVGPSDLQVEW